MKLQAKDLMIGNLLDFNGMECIVKEIDEQGVVVSIEETGEEEWIDLFQFTPIPITEEYLLRFGWRYYNGRNEGVMTKDFTGKLDIDFYEGKIQVKSHYQGYNLYTPIDIQYVHELQNLITILNTYES